MEPIELAVARSEVIRAALSLQASVLWAELHSDDAHAGDQIDLDEDIFDAAISNYVKVKAAT